MIETRRSRQSPKAWYALRRTLPPFSYRQNLKELVQVLPRYGVDELIVKVDSEEFTHGQPPLAWVRRYQKVLFEIKQQMQRRGIVYSINPWITLGHNDRGRHARKALPGLQTIVGHDGSQAICCACPLCEVWRANTAKVWTLYAQTEPHTIWVEDDIRTYNHATVQFGCFCRKHMKHFSQRIGKKVQREQLVEAILKPGRPHPWRRAYLDVHAELMNETVSFLAKVVHKVSPHTSLGLMSSGPTRHCVEGRHWASFARALADGQVLYSRPPLGSYSEASLRGLYYTHDSIKITRHCLPKDTIELAEVENVPFTQYSKSTAFTFLQMAVSLAFGSHGVTMNLFDHSGTPMETEPAFGDMLRRKKPFLHALARRAQPPGSYQGVGVLFDERAAYYKRLSPGADIQDLAADGPPTVEMLESHGIPTTYDSSPVTATSGQLLGAWSNGAIEDLLSRGLLVDATAARVLAERGFAKEIGLRSIDKPKAIDELGTFSAEEYFNRKFGGADRKFLTLTIPNLGGRPSLSILSPVRSAEIISRIVDPDTKRHHVCMYSYENQRGGRVIVHALEHASAYGVSFNHTFRAQQLRAAIRWLARGRVPLFVYGGVYPLAFRKELEDRTLLGLFNLTLDPWPFVDFELTDRRTVDRMEVLSPAGRWRSDRNLSSRKVGGRVLVKYEKRVPFDAPLLVTLNWK